MSADAAVASPGIAQDLRALRVYRYAMGSTIAMGVALGINWPLSYMVPMLSLSFLATPDPCPTLKRGLSFVAVVAGAVLFGTLLAAWLLPFPLVFVPLVTLVLFRIFYAKASGSSPLLVMWLMIAVLVIPLVTMLSPGMAVVVAFGLVGGAAATILMVWITYLFFPDPPGVSEVAAEAAAPPAPELPSPRERFRAAVETTLVVAPVFVLFYTLQLADSILILIFIALLSSQPGFAQSYKGGVALIMGNVIGGMGAIIFYNLLIFVPEFYFMLMLTLLFGLIFSGQLFSGKKTAPLFGMAFSTVLLVVGSSTTSTDEAGSAVYTRVIQIMVAVVYVVTAFGAIRGFRGVREAKRA